MKVIHSLFIILLISFVNAQGQTKIVDAASPDLVKGKTVKLDKPAYPRLARVWRVGGQVVVKVVIDETGTVVSAKAMTGSSILHPAAEAAALNSIFTPFTLNGVPVRVRGDIIFNFIQYADWESVGRSLSAIQDFIPSLSVGPEANLLWVGFANEKKEYYAIHESEDITGKVGQATQLINTLREKLKAQPPDDLWYFNLGYVTAKLEITSRNDKRTTDFQQNLRELKNLALTAPEVVPAERLKVLKEVGASAENRNLTKDERIKLVQMLTEIRNQFLAGEKGK